MNDVQSLMTAAAILAMGGLGLFMYKPDEDTRRDTPVEKQEIQEKTDEEIETEIKPKKTRKMRKRGPSGGSRHRF